MARDNSVNSAGLRADRILVWAWSTFFFVVIALICLIRIRLLHIPLERDEGEYAYAGQLLLRGIPPYQFAYNMKFPGTYAAYASLMSIFGQTIVGIHLGLLFVNLAAIALLFLIGRQLISSIGGTVAAASYAILSVCSSVLGLAAHATHFVVLPMLAGTFCLLRPPDQLSKKLVIVSGVFFGLALLMKQPALFFILFGAAYLWIRDRQEQLPWKKILQRNLVFLGSAAIPFAITCLLLWRAGVFAKFWFWTVTYARAYGGIVSGAEAVQMFSEEVRHVVDSAWPLWILALIGLAACWWNKKLRGRGSFLVTFLVFSALALCPGFYFRDHYFIMLFPALSLLVGTAIVSVEEFSLAASLSFRFLPLLALMAASVVPLLAQRRYLAAPDPTIACAEIYGITPFPAAIDVARYLQEHTNPGDRIAVLGSEPEIYFYAHRLSATGYIYMYALTELQSFASQMQREMIREIETAHPRYFVYVQDDFSWLVRENSEKLVTNWFRRYSSERLSLVGLINLPPSGRSEYYFPAPPTPESISLSKNYLLVFERKPEAVSP